MDRKQNVHSQRQNYAFDLYKVLSKEKQEGGEKVNGKKEKKEK